MHWINVMPFCSKVTKPHMNKWEWKRIIEKKSERDTLNRMNQLSSVRVVVFICKCLGSVYTDGDYGDKSKKVRNNNNISSKNNTNIEHKYPTYRYSSLHPSFYSSHLSLLLYTAAADFSLFLTCILCSCVLSLFGLHFREKFISQMNASFVSVRVCACVWMRVYFSLSLS